MLGGGLEGGLGIEEGLADAAAGEGGDVLDGARIGDANPAKEGFDFVRGRRFDFVDFEAGLEALLEFVELAVAGGDNGGARREIVEEEKETGLRGWRDGVGLLDPDEAVGAEEVFVVKVLGDLDRKSVV